MGTYTPGGWRTKVHCVTVCKEPVSTPNEHKVGHFRAWWQGQLCGKRKTEVQTFSDYIDQVGVCCIKGIGI